jgi:cytochrome c1
VRGAAEVVDHHLRAALRRAATRASAQPVARARDDRHPPVKPKFARGLAEGTPERRGFGTFREQCVHCHAINRQGGRVGPELNVPKSIVEYRPIDQIKAYIRDPLTFRYSTMPPHPKMTDQDLDDLVSYFTAMKERKHDEETAKPPGSVAPAPSSSAPPAPSSSARSPGDPQHL